MPKFFIPDSWSQNEKAFKFNSSNQIKQNSLKNNPCKADNIKKSSKHNKSKMISQTRGNEQSKIKLLHPTVSEGHVKKSKQTKHNKNLTKLSTMYLGDATNSGMVTLKEESTSFTSKLREDLMGGRFRYINEQLYTMDSKNAEKLFQENQNAYIAYHEGYRQQIKKWPINPLDRIIKMVRGLPKSFEIGDFGCGDGRLSKEVPHKVYSIDLVSIHDDVIASDMANTPLATESLDVAVYCLSLMGTNLKEYLLEANRVLKLNGFVYIAEIQSRFENVREFVQGLAACGFELVKKDVWGNFFYFLQFKKLRNVGKIANIPNFSLNACLYRKR